MKIKLSIGKRIGGGFGVLIFLTLINFIYTLKTVNDSSDINKQIIEVYNPSVDKLEDLNLLIVRSNLLIRDWLKQEKSAAPSKRLLPQLINEKYPRLELELQSLAKNWNIEQRDRINKLFKMIHTLWEEHQQAMAYLGSFGDYQEPINVMLAEEIVEQGGIESQTTSVLEVIDELSLVQRKQASSVSTIMLNSLATLVGIVSSSGVFLVLIGLIIAFLTVRSIVRPVYTLKDMLNSLGKGILPEKRIDTRADEIGEMGVAMNQLVKGLKETIEFSKQVGMGNFHAPYSPLSDKDTLGHALLQMRDELYELKENLEEIVKARTEEVVKQGEEIQYQSKEIEAKNEKLEEIYATLTDSIHYAKRIQQSILPPISQLKNHFSDSFIFYRPKDIVSGDFYWMDEKNGKVLISAVDCTGHGVPGAFMSIVGYNNLNLALAETPNGNAAKILDHLNANVKSALKQTTDGNMAKDGMDVAFCSFDLENKKLDFAGAYNPLYRFRRGELEIVKGNKFPIGIHILKSEDTHFTNYEIDMESGDVYYIFSDGYADQFGGPKVKKFMYRRFREMLSNIHDKPMEEQRDILGETIDSWMDESDQDQLDDILVIGVRIP
jgi:serine phosphatase RsbU (regulator of sigma subunit)/HAMP domain-containing protein